MEGWRWQRGVAHQHVLGVAQDRVREQNAEEHRGQRNQLLHLLLGRHHRRDARLEAHRRWLVRSTNTGVSAFIDPVGRVAVAGELFTRQNLVAEIEMLEGETLWVRLGDVIGWGGFCLGLGVLAASLRRRGASRDS